MKKTFLTVVAILGVVALGACSKFGKKSTVNPNAPVVDAASANTQPVPVVSKAFDGGKYDERGDITDVKAHGGKTGDTIPTEKFYSLDREKNAPVGKLLYVLTDESPARCVLAKFTNVDEKKRLIVYSKNPVPSGYCIYQKKYSAEAEGFSIWMKDGGICKPSFATVVEDQKRKVATVDHVNNIVSFSWCTENTVSYGAEMARGKR